MDIATGAMNTLLPKLAELVVGEYKLQKGAKGDIEELEKELSGMNIALRKVAKVPVDQLDEQVKIWASDVRELSYDIEDAVDTFMFCSKGHEPAKPFSLKGFIGKATNLFKKAKSNHQIHNVVKDIMDQVKQVSERRDRYKVDQVAAGLSTVTVDPRLEGLYRKATELVGIDEPKNELVKRLKDEDSLLPLQRPKIISIVGFGGLGKTTLANALVRDLKAKFDCHVFVSVSLNPDLKKIFKNILLQLDEKNYSHIDEAWEINQLIDKIIEFLKNRRCLCVIDDVWKESAWDTIKLALQNGNHRSKIIVTTRNRAVAEHVGGGVYELKPLSNKDSKLLFNKRIFDIEDECPRLREVSEKILKKCGGVPLAIITTASLLASKFRDPMEWEKVNNSIGSGLEKSPDVEKMRNILSLSYNDLPFDLKSCLLSLNKYPEDEEIRKDVLIWSWIAEDFIAKETQPAGRSLQEIGESYFSELINRSLIQPADTEFYFPLLKDDGQQASTHTSVVQKRKIRRLSLHSSNKSYASPEAREQLSKVRSLTVFGMVKSIPPLSSLHVLRLLHIEDCDGLDKNHLNDLGDLRHLRFLRLQGLKVTELPESIGKLESLETLDIRGTRSVILLPVSFGKLGKLVSLLADRVELPDSLTMENMKSLQELDGIRLTLHAVTEICKLSKLKVLTLDIEDEPEDRLQMCLQMCPSLQVLVLRTPYIYYSLDFMALVPSGLQRFMSSGFFTEAFPRWINPSLSCLTVLYINLDNVCVLPENLEKLAELPSLRFLSIYSPNSPRMQEILIVPTSASAFPCLIDLQFQCDFMFLKFDYGAMRKLQILRLLFNAQDTNQCFASNNFGYGLENLPSLHRVVVRLLDECPEAEDAIRKAINDNPNHPSLEIF